jgi:molybdopterin-biosynthesis enzyme MoeA-like protein
VSSIEPAACNIYWQEHLSLTPGLSHDDITYQSIARAFNIPLVLHQPALERMKRLSKPHPSQPNFNWDVDSAALRAKLRMVELPIDNARDIEKQVIFPREDFWVPVSVVNGNVHILPGVPRLCTLPGPVSYHSLCVDDQKKLN